MPALTGRRLLAGLLVADRTGSATIKLLWSGPGTAKQVIPATRLLAN